MLNKDSFLIFLTGVVAFTIGLSPEFIGLDCRFAVFAQEMLRNGPTFFPTTYGRPYPDYPGTSTFMIYLVSLLLGKVTPFTAILPTAVVSALILVFIYRIGAMHSRQWGLFAVLFALFTIEFFGLSRSISTDQYTSLATVLCFYLAYSANVYGRQKRLRFIPLLFIASFAFRGPIGLVIPAGVLCFYYLYNRDFKKIALIASASAILLVICSLVLLAAAKYQGGEAFVKQVIETQITGRIRDNPKHWIGYFFTESFARYAISYPFTVFVVVVLYKKIFGRENADYRLLGSLVIWILVVLIGMSVPSTKKIRYILPMIPAVALVASYMFIDPMQKGILPGIKKIFLQFCLWFPLGTVVVIIAAWATSEKFEFLSGANYLATIILTTILAAAAWVLNHRLKESFMRDLAFMAVGTVTFIVIVVGINEPINYYLNITKPFVAKVEALRSQQPGEVVFYKINADSEAIKFTANLDKPFNPRFINDAEDILNFQIPTYFIAMKDDFDALPKNVKPHINRLDSGKISRDDCIVFICGTSQP
jgi:4-amino-4-deoxy-L-arabinose transferase-like glycosyltransferase